jgi:uncharacterized protein YbgA (DUF1722 family)/uncharacterized protein YbbK (DUF523 family)
MIRDDFVAKLGRHVEFVKVCPEMEIGLGVPRHPIRVVLANGERRLLQPSTDRDVSEPMREFCERFLGGLGEVDGFILKSRSPSCGFKDVKIHGESGMVLPSIKRHGFFGGAVVERFPNRATEDEGRLKNYLIRERFLSLLFALARFRATEAERAVGRLVEFHARNKLLLLAYSETVMRELGRIVANPGRRPPAVVFADYGALLPTAFRSPPKYSAAINVLDHARGYFKDGLSREEKAHFSATLESYRAGRVPLSVPSGIVRSWVARFGEEYLADQTFFAPYPHDLVEITDSGKGRG